MNPHLCLPTPDYQAQSSPSIDQIDWLINQLAFGLWLPTANNFCLAKVSTPHAPPWWPPPASPPTTPLSLPASPRTAQGPNNNNGNDNNSDDDDSDEDETNDDDSDDDDWWQ